MKYLIILLFFLSACSEKNNAIRKFDKKYPLTLFDCQYPDSIPNPKNLTDVQTGDLILNLVLELDFCIDDARSLAKILSVDLTALDTED